MLHKGTQELALSGEMDWDGFDDLDYFVRASYGWFVADGFEFWSDGVRFRPAGQSPVFVRPLQRVQLLP